jgi:hypothetical protein
MSLEVDEVSTFRVSGWIKAGPLGPPAHAGGTDLIPVARSVSS